jgi:hypothetical protein
MRYDPKEKKQREKKSTPTHNVKIIASPVKIYNNVCSP